MQVLSFSCRRLIGAAALACAAALIPAAAFATTAAPASWKIVKTVRANNGPGFDAVTATGPPQRLGVRVNLIQANRVAAQRVALDSRPVPRHGRRNCHLRRLDLSR
jgi:hypothetical protein